MKLLKWACLSLTAVALLAAPPPNTNGAADPAKAGKHASAKLNINTATAADLTQLGIAEADAAKIVQNRPYHAKNELRQKKIIPAAAYRQIKSRIVAR